MLETNLKKSDILLTQLAKTSDAVFNVITLAKALGIDVVVNPNAYFNKMIQLLLYINKITSNKTQTSLMFGINVNRFDTFKLIVTKIHSFDIQTIIILFNSNGPLAFYVKNYRYIQIYGFVLLSIFNMANNFIYALSLSQADGEFFYPIADGAIAFSVVEREGTTTMSSCQNVLDRMAN